MLRCFVGAGVETVTLASDPDAPSFFSRHCGQRRLLPDPGAEPEAALAGLRELGKLLPGRPVLFYGDDAMLLLVSRQRAKLKERFRFLLPDAALVEALVDKKRFAALAQELALPVPRTLASPALETAAAIAALLPPPVILKPFCHLGWRTSRAVVDLGVGPGQGAPRRRRARARPDDRAHGEVLLRAHRAGVHPRRRGAGLHFHAYVDAGRRPLGHYVGRKIRTYPRRAGVSTYLELVDEPELSRLGFDILERLGLVGVVKLDFKRDPRTGRFYLLEVNPRFSLWNHLGAASGVNLPLLAYRDLAGLPVTPAPLPGSASAGSRSPTTRARSCAGSRPRASSRWGAGSRRCGGRRCTTSSPGTTSPPS